MSRHTKRMTGWKVPVWQSHPIKYASCDYCGSPACRMITYQHVLAVSDLLCKFSSISYTAFISLRFNICIHQFYTFTYCIWIARLVLMIWWHHQMETFSMLLAFAEGNPPFSDGFPSQRPVTQSFDVFFDVRLNKRLNKQSRCWWFETPWHVSCRHCYVRLYKTSSSIYCFCTFKIAFVKVNRKY